MNSRDDAEALARQLIGSNDDQKLRSLISSLVSGDSLFVNAAFGEPRQPDLLEVPERPLGFRVRLDLSDTKPPVWRRLDLPGDLTLDRLHDVIQVAMGWTDSHLHRFRTGNAYNSPHFVTAYDLEEGDEGLVEDQVRLDQVVRKTGDRLWYEYDFGDSWGHVLKVERVLDEPPAAPLCVTGKKACPPEDCGGVWGYAELAAWVRGGHKREALPPVFESQEDALDWLPLDWDPDVFSVEQVNEGLAELTAVPIEVTGELAELAQQLESRMFPLLRRALARPAWHEPVQVSAQEAARLTESYKTLLEVIGDGVTLTAARRFPPAVVHTLAERTGIIEWWIGKANREDQTYPVVELRETAQALGLVSVRKGRLAPTAAARRIADDPQALWAHIASRLPLGSKKFDRDAGWVALAVVGSGTKPERWSEEIAFIVEAIGWQTDGPFFSVHALSDTPTLRVLEILGGAMRTGFGRPDQADAAVAATARAAVLGLG